MSSKRIVVSCAAMALVVATGSRYAVSAFPLQNTVSGAQSSSSNTAGPLERRAQAITPENPIPRRIGYVAPIFPDAVGDARGTVTVRLTIDELGRVAESRVTGLSIKGAGYSVSMSGDNTRKQLDAALGRSSMRAEGGAAIDTASVREAGDTFIAAALTSIRQWRYDPPANGPLSFPMTVSFGATPAQEPTNALEVKPEGTSQWMLDGGAIRVGGNIKAPTKIRDVRPVYPAEARAANIQGIVIIEARIDTDGRVSNARVLKSISMLDQAALDAVYQWQFTPTLLNGQAVPVIMTVTVNFTMM